MTHPRAESQHGTSAREVNDHVRGAGGLRVLIVAGGTGGHVFPALAVAQELRSRWTSRNNGQREEAGLEIQFLGTNRALESRVIPAAGFQLRVIRAAGLKGISGIKRLQNLLVLPRTVIETAQVLRQFRPGVVVGMGGYLSGPAMLEAALVGIPTLLIEPNAIPGFTNRMLAPLVSIAALGFEAAAHFYGASARLTGHPLRQAFFAVKSKQHDRPFRILVLGGSQGSVAVNRAVIESLPVVHRQIGDLQIVHQTGERDYNNVRQAYGDLSRDLGISVEVQTFIEDVAAALEGADLVISRSGASAVAELAAAQRASILVPLPSAADNHQQANAEVMERAGAARMVLQRDLIPERLARVIVELLRSPGRLREMERAGSKLARPDATRLIADLIEGLGGNDKPSAD